MWPAASGWSRAQPPRVPAAPQQSSNRAPSAFSPGQTRYNNQFLHHENAAHRAAQAATSRQTTGSELWRRGSRPQQQQQQRAGGRGSGASGFFSSAQGRNVHGAAPVSPGESTPLLTVPPGFPVPDESTSSSWVFPTNEEFAEREYQRRIIETSLFHNTLVSLPTGLGKTFIAAVVMYNFYRWFPKGQIVFMAPTRPLVRQQIAACHSITGLPEHDTAEVQGSTKPKERSELWRSRRVVFCTPQSLDNDLKHHRAVAKSIVLLVVDEAHRATGKYAYCEVVRSLDTQHQAAGWASPVGRYRLLALSATPGSDLERVQDVVTNLHISKLEVRTEIDPDVQPYTHGKTINKVTVPLSPQLDKMKKAFMDLMRPPVLRLFSLGVLPFKDPKRVNVMSLRHFQEQFRQQPTREAMSRDEIFQVQADLSLLMSLSSALRELTTHGTMAFHRSLLRLEQNGNTTRSKNLLFQDKGWKRLLGSLQQMDRLGQHMIHPKLVKLSQVLHEHFARRSAAGTSTRAIVFTQTRTSVDEIMRFLKDHPAGPPTSGKGYQPTLFSMGQANSKAESDVELRPAVFVGQGAGARVAIRKANAAIPAQDDGEGEEEDDEEVEQDDDDEDNENGDGGVSGSNPWWTAAAQSKQAAASRRTTGTDAVDDGVSFEGSTVKGQTQKEQVNTIRRFRSGAVNVLVATCIGEEGLDIGDVGLIVMFDAVGSPIRTIQRLGRTGRSRSGECVALVTPGTESDRFDRSFQSYRRIALSMRNNANRFRLLASGPRLLSLVSGMPYPPPMQRKELKVGQFRLSQVGGLESRTKSGAAGKGTSRDIRDWGVTRSQERFVTTRCQVEAGEAPVRLGNDRGLAQIMRLDRMDPRHIALQEALDPTFLTDANHSSRSRLLSFLLRHMHEESVSQRSASLSASIASDDVSSGERDEPLAVTTHRQPLRTLRDSSTALAWDTVTDPSNMTCTAQMFDEMVRIGKEVDEHLREPGRSTSDGCGAPVQRTGEKPPPPLLRESQEESRTSRVAELVKELDNFSEEDDDFEESDKQQGPPQSRGERDGASRMQDDEEEDEDGFGMADPFDLWGSQREAVAGGVLCGGESPTGQEARIRGGEEDDDVPLSSDEIEAMFADATALLGPVPRLDAPRGASPIRSPLDGHDLQAASAGHAVSGRQSGSLQMRTLPEARSSDVALPRTATPPMQPPIPRSHPPRSHSPPNPSSDNPPAPSHLEASPIPSPERMPPPSSEPRSGSPRHSSVSSAQGASRIGGVGSQPQRTPVGSVGPASNGTVVRPTPPSSAESQPVVRPTRRRLLAGKRIRSVLESPQESNDADRGEASDHRELSQEFKSSQSQEEPVQPAAKRRRRGQSSDPGQNHVRRAIQRRFFELDAEEDEEDGQERGQRRARHASGGAQDDDDGDGSDGDDNYDYNDGFLDDRPLSQLTSQSSQGDDARSAVLTSSHEKPKKPKKPKRSGGTARGMSHIEYLMQQQDRACMAQFTRRKGAGSASGGGSLLQEIMRQMEAGGGALVDQAREADRARRRKARRGRDRDDFAEDCSDDEGSAIGSGEDSFVVDDFSEGNSVFASPPGSDDAFKLDSVSQGDQPTTAQPYPQEKVRSTLRDEATSKDQRSVPATGTVPSSHAKNDTRSSGGVHGGDEGETGGKEGERETPAVVALSRHDSVFAPSKATGAMGQHPKHSAPVDTRAPLTAGAPQPGSPPKKMTKEQAAIVARAQMLTRLVGLDPGVAREVAAATRSLSMQQFAQVSPPELCKLVGSAPFTLQLAAKTRAHVMKWLRTREQTLGAA